MTLNDDNDDTNFVVETEKTWKKKHLCDWQTMSYTLHLNEREEKKAMTVSGREWFAFFFSINKYTLFLNEIILLFLMQCNHVASAL